MVPVTKPLGRMPALAPLLPPLAAEARARLENTGFARFARGVNTCTLVALWESPQRSYDSARAAGDRGIKYRKGSGKTLARTAARVSSPA